MKIILLARGGIENPKKRVEQKFKHLKKMSKTKKSFKDLVRIHLA